MIWKIKTDSEVIVELGVRLKQRRKEMKLSQVDLAKKCGASRTSIQEIEKGSSITVTSLVAILRGLSLLDQFEEFFPKPVELSPKEKFLRAYGNKG